jgi:hypothetical protein
MTAPLRAPATPPPGKRTSTEGSVARSTSSALVRTVQPARAGSDCRRALMGALSANMLRALDKEINLKINKHFMEYVTNWNYETYLCVGAYGSSKSYETATMIVLKCLEEKRKVLVVRDTYEQIKESCYDLLYEILDSLEIVTEDKSGDNRFKYVIRSSNRRKIKYKSRCNKTQWRF